MKYGRSTAILERKRGVEKALEQSKNVAEEPPAVYWIDVLLFRIAVNKIMATLMIPKKRRTQTSIVSINSSPLQFIPLLIKIYS